MAISISDIVSALQQYYTVIEKAFFILAAIYGLFGTVNVFNMFMSGHPGAKKALVNLVAGFLVMILSPIVLRQLIH